MRNRGFSLKLIILIMSVLMVSVPIIIFGIIEFKVAAKRASADAHDFIENDILSVQRNIKVIFDSAQAKVGSNLILAELVLNSKGSFYLDKDSTAEMEAVHQISREGSKVSLPAMMAGGKVLAYDYKMVDEIQSYVGGTATIFQLIPDGLLRISTNVLNEDFSRATGTYIPKDSPVYKTVMDGVIFYGRAYVVNEWYITAYKPILNFDGGIIGVLCVGVKEINYKKKVITGLLQKKLGNDGYYEIVDGIGCYEMPHNWDFYGKNVFDIKDVDGNNFMRQLVDSAVKLEPEKLGSLSYNWKESADAVTRERTSSFIYFEPWNWVIIANIYNDDLVRERVGEDLVRIVLIIAVFSILGIVVAVFIARAISNPLVHTQHSVERISAGNLTRLIEIRTGVKELKLLGTSIDTELIPRISGIIKEILNSVAISGNISNIMQNYSKDAGDISGRLNGEIENIDTEMVSLDGQIAEASSAVTEILATIENLVSHIASQSSAVSQTSAAIEEMTASINSIAKIAAEKSEATRGLISTVETGRNKVSISNDQIKNISTDVNNMMDIIGVINSIAA
ncbi:MAG: methyl-accepting chemotaxis protein, partial [Spirochaetales bacterium]|nr:methyl-accepting chemotaxis protein [Spirochaetales bacterium]